jgi:ABC-2 type transport system permease protein
MRVIWANILAIYRRELQSYFTAPLSYGIAGVFWLLAGFFFLNQLLGPQGFLAQAAMYDQMGNPNPVDLPYEFLKAYVGLLGSLSLFILPVLSMGLYAEERKRGTLELLATSPVTNWAVAVGKLVAVLTFFMTLLIPLMIYQAVVLSTTNPPFQPTIFLLGHGGLILMAASILSLGMFISSLTDSTILAAILTFALALFLWVIDVVAGGFPGPIGDVLGHLSLLKNFNTLLQGTLDTSSLIAFASYILLGIFLTAQSIDALRFQRS